MTRVVKSSKEKLKILRGFVDFDYDLRKPLSASARRKINKYYAAFSELTARPNYVYRPRLGAHLKAAQKFAQHPKGLKFKVAFIPTAGDEIPDINWSKKGAISVKTGKKRIRTGFLDFDEDALIEDPGEHCRDVIKEAPGAEWFSIAAGVFEIRRAIKRPFIAREVERLAAAYSGEKPQSAPGQNHYFGNWMTGLRVYDFEDQADAGEYMQAKTEAARKDQRKRRAAKRRANKVYYWINHSLRKVKVAKEPQPSGWEKVSRSRMNAAIRSGYGVA